MKHLIYEVFFNYVRRMSHIITACYAGENRKSGSVEQNKNLTYNVIGLATENKILRQLYQYKEVEIIEAHAMSDHIHMLVMIPPKLAVSSFMGYLKGKSSLMIFERHANLKYKYVNRNFWAKGYFVSTVGLKDEVVREYIRNQESEDMASDKINLKE